MPIQSPTKTDDELIAILDVNALWVVRAGGPVLAAPGTLRNALHKVRQQSGVGAPITSIMKMPNDEIVIGAEQIYRLWQRLDLA